MPVRQQAFRHPPAGNLQNDSLRRSPRSQYPIFLSVQDTVLFQLTWAWRGLMDAFRWNVVVSTVAGDSEIRANLCKSLMLNTLSLLSIYTFDHLLLPLIRDQQKWLHRNVGWSYQALWLLPVVGISLYLNSSWCSTIAKRAYTLRHGNRSAGHQRSVSYTGLLKSIATSAYRFVMIVTSVGVSFVLQNIPFAGPFVGFAFFCWVDSYYCFEFVWIAQGLSLPRRVRYLEERWAYYLAFGLPSAALCNWGSGLANAALFALVFPVFIILAVHARPVPADPYCPVALSPAPNSNGQENIRHPSPFVPIRLPIFALVIWLNDWIVRILSLSGGGGRVSNARRPLGRGRTFSDMADSVEDGEVAELNAVKRSWKGSGPANGHGLNTTRGKAD